MDIERAIELMNRCINQLTPHLQHPASLRFHCHSVSYASRVIAEALAISGMTIDVEKTAVMGMIHDIGRSEAGDVRHGIEGYWLALQAGVSPNIASICITHMTLGRTMKESVEAGFLTVEEARVLTETGVILENLSLEDQVVGVVDSRVLNGNFVSVEDRICELVERKGELSLGARYNLDHILELGRALERMLGYSLIKLFPEGKLRVETSLI